MHVFIYARTSLNSFLLSPRHGVLFLPFFPFFSYQEFTCTVTACRQLYTTPVWSNGTQLRCSARFGGNSLSGYGYILHTNTTFLGELAYLSDIKEIDNT